MLAPRRAPPFSHAADSQQPQVISMVSSHARYGPAASSTWRLAQPGSRTSRAAAPRASGGQGHRGSRAVAARSTRKGAVRRASGVVPATDESCNVARAAEALTAHPWLCVASRTRARPHRAGPGTAASCERRWSARRPRGPPRRRRPRRRGSPGFRRCVGSAASDGRLTPAVVRVVAAGTARARWLRAARQADGGPPN